MLAPAPSLPESCNHPRPCSLHFIPVHSPLQWGAAALGSTSVRGLLQRGRGRGRTGQESDRTRYTNTGSTSTRRDNSSPQLARTWVVTLNLDLTRFRTKAWLYMPTQRFLWILQLFSLLPVPFAAHAALAPRPATATACRYSTSSCVTEARNSELVPIYIYIYTRPDVTVYDDGHFGRCSACNRSVPGRREVLGIDTNCLTPACPTRHEYGNRDRPDRRCQSTTAANRMLSWQAAPRSATPPQPEGLPNYSTDGGDRALPSRLLGHTSMRDVRGGDIECTDPSAV